MNNKSYKNEWFIRELVNASAKKTLEEAAPEWEFSHFGHLDERGNCQICHTGILKFVAIKNRQNGILLLVGEDCYDKLQYFLATQKIGAISLQDRKQYIGQIKKYCKREINEAFLEWFAGRKKLPESIRNTLGVIRQLGYAPNLFAAEEVVGYYKNHRLFAVQEVLDWKKYGEAVKSFPLEKLPKKITLAKLPAIEKEMGAWSEKWKTFQPELRRKVTAGEHFQTKGVFVKGCLQVWFSGYPEFGIMVSLMALDRVAGIDDWRWVEDHEELLKRTLPAQIRLEEPYSGSEIFWLHGDDLGKWVKDVKEAIYEAETPEIIKRCVANTESMETTSASLAHFSGEFNGSYYDVPPSLELVFMVDGTECKIQLPREEIKFKLGKASWSAKLTRLLNETMPPEITPVIKEWTISISEKDLDKWVSRVEEALGREALLPKNKRRQAQAKLNDNRREEALKRGLISGASWRQIHGFDEAKELEERRQKALRLYFRKGLNKKHGTEQWEAWYNNRVYVLRREDIYETSDGIIPIEEVRELIPGRVVLVRRV